MESQLTCEYCYACGEPIALIEVEETDRPTPKPAPVTAELARLARIKAYSVAYAVDETGEDIKHFHVRRIEPYDERVEFMSPEDYFNFLLSLRSGHYNESGHFGDHLRAAHKTP